MSDVRFRCLTVVLLLMQAVCFAGAPITSISHIRAMMPDEVDGTVTAEIEGQVLALPLFFGIFLYDGTNGIFVSHKPVPEFAEKLKPGDWIRVNGIVEPGGFSPAIVADQIELIDHRPLPEPMAYIPDKMRLAEMDCQWVFLSGRLIAVSTAENGLDAMVNIESGENLYSVQVPYSRAGVERLHEMMYRDVELNAVVGIRYNSRKQAVGRAFIAHSIDDIIAVDHPGSEKDPVDVSLSELMRKDTPSYGLLKTRGVVTGVFGKELFLRGDAAGLRVQTAKSTDVEPGDYVEITGYVWPQPISPAFRALEVERLKTQPMPEPRQVPVGAVPDEALNYDLIALHAELIDIGKQFSEGGAEQQILLCRSGAHRFEARLPVGKRAEEGISAGAELMLTGNAHLLLNPHTQGKLKITGFWLQLRDAEDIQLLRAAPWWTPERMMWVFSALLGVIVLFLGWLVLLRQTIRRQTGIIKEKVEREAVLEERQRIARELHDNLEQGLGGIAIQLQNCRMQNALISEKPEENVSEDLKNGIQKTDRAISVAQHMLAHCSKESRAAILDLRGVALQRKALADLVKEALAPVAKECGARLEMTVSGNPVQLSRRVERHLMLIAKEAGSNAARHAAPKILKVGLRYESGRVVLTVRDDGCGFNPSSPEKEGHFGLKGMEERAVKMNGTFRITSAPGEGAEVYVEVPNQQVKQQ
ncbi:ATP-binding protein [Pontiella agarivorans]|uniref:Histidine kinase n=1 Tax=Pontiella agarivorans TaxID=3038953 RepID=A0ABU5MTN4_9BACT|nr:ATP-binding protein [Pontiella agarivorans]MDZ8117528.1 histidine kinase [Pontiella agarivorans]